MRKLSFVNTLSSESISLKIKAIKGYNDVIDWKIIQCRQQNPEIDAITISKVLCVSIHKVYKVIEGYNKKGTSYKLDSQWGGRRQQTCFLSIDEEKEVLDMLIEKGQKGLLLTAKDIKVEFEKRIGQNVSEDYIWKVLKKHNWTKKTPRPEHPNANFEAQEEFKKNLKKIWQPQH